MRVGFRKRCCLDTNYTIGFPARFKHLFLQMFGPRSAGAAEFCKSLCQSRWPGVCNSAGLTTTLLTARLPPDGSNAEACPVSCRSTKRRLAIGVAVAILAFLVDCRQYLARHFPFRRDVLLAQLHANAETTIEIGQFTDDWF